MAWPFSGNSGGNKSADQNLSEERLKILANVAIEQVPFPEQGMLSEEDAWTISPGPTTCSDQQPAKRARTWQRRSHQPPHPVPAAPATVDTSGLERLISSRLDMVEDVLRMVEHRLDEGVPSTPRLVMTKMPPAKTAMSPTTTTAQPATASSPPAARLLKSAVHLA